jgi:hypothetical protein
METIFPTDTGCSAIFFTSLYRHPVSSAIRQVFAFVLKRTYDVAPDHVASTTDPVTGTLTPSSSALPIFLQDQEPVLLEADIVPFKPEGDGIVIPSAAPAPTALDVAGVAWLRNAVVTDTAAFAWQPRTDNPRKDQAGSFPTNDPLPSNFDNRFFNGYMRAAIAPPRTSLPLFTAGAPVVLQRGAANFYRFRLGNEAPIAHYEYFRGGGPDVPELWRTTSVPIRMDTMVLLPDANRCYVNWRGTWLAEEQPEDNYRRLVVSLGG